MDHFKRNMLVIVALAIIDQVLKWLVQFMQPDADLGLVWIHEVRNTGASFGILQDNNWLLALIAIAVLAVIILNAKKISDKQSFPVALVIAGIIGNLVDRVARGYVVDFFDLKWWPAFNVADSCIFIGVFWLAILLFKEDSEPATHQKTKPKKAI